MLGKDVAHEVVPYFYSVLGDLIEARIPAPADIKRDVDEGTAHLADEEESEQRREQASEEEERERRR
jgi:hypothetical protein